ncbi:flavin reductase family protein [Massilia sp. W12]|uniref:flavin reductase family protein n=1 Tax=Massilia sp. W12 TaxID=3126507 RepID=UPI0030D19EDD
MHTPIPLEKSWRLLNHGPTVLVSAAHQGRRNVMAASWNMPLDFTPPKVAVVIDKNTVTCELIKASGYFALNVPSRALAAATVQVGNRSARDLPAGQDKFAWAGLQTFAGSLIGAPLIGGCLGWLECRVLPEPELAHKYDLYLAEIIAAHADPRAFQDGHWNFAEGMPRSIHYIAGGHFFESGEQFSEALPE